MTRADAAAGSWLGLLASTVGDGGLDRVRTFIRLGDGRRGFSIAEGRLVVQTYRPADVRDGRVRPGARPMGSSQRKVVAGQLVLGTHVDVFHDGTSEDVTVVAWVEAGEPNLEYDGLQARPGAAAILGVGGPAAVSDVVEVVLARRAGERAA